MFAAGSVDVMIADNIEAMLMDKRSQTCMRYRRTKRLRRMILDMLPRDDFALLNWMNLWMYQMSEKGEFDRLKAEWIAE